MYEDKLAWFIKGRPNNLENYVEQKNSLGQSVWMNIKTLKEEYENPIKKIVQTNVRNLRSESEKQFSESVSYLRNKIDQLEDDL